VAGATRARSRAMKFGYFTLSDNRYADNPRSAEAFMLEIREQAILAERLGLNSAWIGEHHFNRRGCVSTPALLLASIAAATTRLRLGPAVVVLPIHHPIHVAEEWAALDQLSAGRVDFAVGRGYDVKEYEPFAADFQASAETFAEGVEVLSLCWNAEGPVSFAGKHFRFDDIEVTPRPFQRPFLPYMGSFSRFSMAIAAQYGWHLLLAPFAASLIFGGLRQAVAAYGEECDKAGRAPGKAKCSYFIHIGESARDMQEGRDRLLAYFTLSGLHRRGEPPRNLPPSMEYYRKIGAALAEMRAESLGDNSILLGSPAHIIEVLKGVEKAGIEEVILYFNYGQKPDAMVREQMERFTREIAPAFAG
jgi:alkanesulfonate monooxygenase SsuD/methylene tetrahydromethanopterin reductase-like flavin-dependent oxidoreductase (luciferase family)